jgi:ATP-dependent exoDNAse (exonuclease V) beta subunit
VTHDDELLHADEQARIDALDVTRSFIVQAPAGSGKTELLIQRYLHLLATVDNPEEVLAITFTRKAAAEMQYRVLQALLRAKRGEVPAEAHEKTTADAAVAALERDRSRRWRLIEYPARMKIQTLDSLNASISRMRPLTGSTAIANAVAEEAEVRKLYRDAAAATLDWLAELGSERDAIEKVLMHLDNNTGLYTAYLSRMLETRDQWLPFIGQGKLESSESLHLRQLLEANLERIVDGHLAATRAAVPRELLPELLPLARYSAENLAEAGDTGNPIAELVSIEALPPGRVEGGPQWLGLADLLLTKQGNWRRQVNKNQGFPPGDTGQKQDFHALLESLSGYDELLAALHDIRSLPPTRYTDEQWAVLLALFELLPVAVAELQRMFSARRLTDYIEIAIGASDALGTAESPGDIALLLDYQVRHVLVDEMQDTSRAQYRLLEALTGGWVPGDGRTLFCVGDPMQSIYRFRNADVAQILLAREAGIGSIVPEPLLLRRNFRSGDFLVHWFNTVFPQVLPDADDPARGAVSYAEAVPGRGTEGDCWVYPVFGSDPAAEADQGCRIIAETLDRYPEDQMAVLVRSRTQLTELLPRLRQAGIAYQSVDIDRLTDLPEVIDLLALTRALAHPSDRIAWLAVLRAPWIGWAWSDLHTLVFNDSDSTVWELLQDKERIRTLSDDANASLAYAMPVLESLMTVSRSESLRDRVERAWLQLGGPAILTQAEAADNVHRYLDVLEKLEVAGTLQDVAELERQLDLERVSNTAEARLQVMTMHRAKGLQFDHVLLFGLGRQARRSDRAVLSWLDLPDSHADEEKIISPVGPRADIETDPIHRFIELREGQKDRHESGRLLYVACTRAKKTLHLVGHTGVAVDGESCKPPQAQSLLKLLWPAIHSEFDAALAGYRMPAADEQGGEWLEPVLHRIEPPWSLPDEAVVPGGLPATDPPVRSDPVEFYWVGAEARVAGTIVHRWLQRAADGDVTLEEGGLEALRPTSARWLREMGFGSGAATAILDRIDSALLGVVTDPRGRWLLEGDGHTEFAITGLIDGNIGSGVIDRVRVDDDGTHWIVDYKTSTHEGGNLEGFLDAELDRYRAQLMRYVALYRAYAAVEPRCALYFPLLQAFRELDV